MKELNLSIIEGNIYKIINTKESIKYFINVDNTELELTTRRYDRVSNFISNELGSSLDFIKDKTIYVISDESKILALRSLNGAMVFIKDGIHFYENITYIKEKYNLTEKEFLDIVSSQFKTKTLKK